MTYEVIVLAAGQGKRMGASKNKQLIEINHIPMIVHTLLVFEKDDWCERIILVGASLELDILASLVNEYGITKVDCITSGGKERQHSVYEGLKNVSSEEAMVLIHDGARPFITIDAIHRLVEKVSVHGAAIVAVPVKDTIKKVENEIVTETVDRKSLWAVQTPQAFRLSTIKAAHNKALAEDVLGTDDASLVEYAGGFVSIVPGDYDNIKITTQEDLYFAKAILEKRKAQGGN